ncbi:MAG: TIGR03756 family integrating conjugative element protein [Pseudoxanthomonas sp.]|jgi:integrating conjugative element protein (TIGR03756 family)|nr:TIGR03756 family integrating conjugative element protein [Pseudoxanthomonas sp.]
MKLSRRMRNGAAAVMLAAAGSSYAINTGTIVASTLSPDCLEYRVVGICYWLYCTWTGCTVRTSVKVRHYVPDAVVSSYSNTGENPWTEVRFMSPPNPTAEDGGDGTTNHDNENNLAKFKNADVIGHPGGQVFSQFASASGYACEGAGTAFMPYLLSTLDTLAWRYNVPEMVYPESLIPGRREVGTRTGLNLWGNVYPRGGFLHQTDDYKSGAVVAQRAGDIVTRRGQIHVYQSLLAEARDGYWPAGELMESDASTGKWQELTPTLSNSCAVFPHTNTRVQAQQGDYAWALWRPYSCCERRGQVFLGSTDFD